MRTLQEKYNAIQEGKFSKDQFLVEARMQHPNIVTRFNGYDDAVQILKNKGMISDVKIEEARLTKNSLTDYRYKPTNEMDKYPYEQILRGLRVELEVMEVYGTPTAEEYAKALAKVSKNLAKDSIFYTNQLAGVNPKVDLHDKMVDATAKNTVDTFNGMKKIKDLKEDHSKNPDDKYTVKPCKSKGEPWAVWEGEKRVKGFATKEDAKEYADKQNKKQNLSESVLKEGIKNLIKKALMENEEDIYEMYGEEIAANEDFGKWRELDPEEKERIGNFVKDTGDRDQAEYEKARKERLAAQSARLAKHIGGGIDESAMGDIYQIAKEHDRFEHFVQAVEDEFGPVEDIAELEHIFNSTRGEDDIDYGDENFSDPMIDKDIPGFEGTRDALDNLFESKSLKDLLN